METRSHRTASIDACRGLAIVLMVLDHTRDYFSSYPYSPTDPAHPDAWMFLMRFVTHFCAPWFVFLAGVGIGLSLANGKPRADVSRFLFTRGLWLVFVELVIIRYGCFLDFIPDVYYLGIIWALGMTMVALSALIYLPASVFFLIALPGLLGHNLLDVISLDPSSGLPYWLVFFFRNQGELHLGSLTFDIDFPFGVWTCLAMSGVIFARLWSIDRVRRIKIIWALAALMITGFVMLRTFCTYGDPVPFVAQESLLKTVLAFLNNEKYPPSLSYLLMTMGPGLLFLAACETFEWQLHWLQIFGRVPMFFYMIHFPVINSMALLWFFIMDPARTMTGTLAQGQAMRFDFGFHSLGVVMWWALFLVVFYFLCVRYGQFKQNNPQWRWLRYV